MRDNSKDVTNFEVDENQNPSTARFESPRPAHGGKWHVDTMNDGYFVIDKRPQPAPVDYVREIDHGVNVIAACGSNREVAELLVAEHNALVDLSSNFEYRVSWQREGRVQQIKRYAKRSGALLRYTLLLSPKPWECVNKKAADRVCCDGRECGCGGETYQAKTERIAKESPLKYARLECRAVGGWKRYETVNEPARDAEITTER